MLVIPIFYIIFTGTQLPFYNFATFIAFTYMGALSFSLLPLIIFFARPLFYPRFIVETDEIVISCSVRPDNSIVGHVLY